MSQPWEAIRFTVHMIPTAKGRPRAFSVGGKARMYTPAKTDQAERDFIALADAYAPDQPFDGPVGLALRFVLPVPASWSRKKREAARYHISKPDLSNFVKTVEDALNRSGRWWRDDSQVARLMVEKVYGSAPQIDVEIIPIGEPSASGARRTQPEAPKEVMAQAEHPL